MGYDSRDIFEIEFVLGEDTDRDRLRGAYDIILRAALRHDHGIIEPPAGVLTDQSDKVLIQACN